MARAIDFNGSNFSFLGGREDVSDARAFTNGSTIITCWQLTAEELAEIVASGGKVYLATISGKTFFPTFVDARSSVREMAVEYGSRTIPAEE